MNISRQAAIDAFLNVLGSRNPNWFPNQTERDVFEAIKSLPSAQPEIIRCGQCKYAEVADPEDSQDGYTCQFHRGSIWFSGSYCSWAERIGDA